MEGYGGIWRDMEGYEEDTDTACLPLAPRVTPTQVGTELVLEVLVLPRLVGRFLGPVELDLRRADLASDDHLLLPVGERTNAVEVVASAQRVGKVADL